MKRVGLILAVGVLLGTASMAVSAEEYGIDLTKMSVEELNNFKADIYNAIDLYHDPSYEEEGDIRDVLEDKVESYFNNGKVNWGSFKYTKEWDYYTVSTNIKYKEDDQDSQKIDISAKFFKEGSDYKLYFLEAGSDLLIDDEGELPEGKWDVQPDPLVFDDTGLDLAVLDEEELNNLINEINNEISVDHTTSSTINNLVLSLVKYQVEQEYNNTSWPWINYTYTNDWGFYTYKSKVTYRDEDNNKQKVDVYAEAYPTNGDYELYYLSVGDDVLIDKRDELPEDLSSSVNSETAVEDENAEVAENDEIYETEAESTKPETEDAENENELQTEIDNTVYAPDTVITGTIIEATMNTITVQTDDGNTYLCSTETTDFELDSGGIMLGMEVAVTLDNTSSDEYGFFNADVVTEVKNTEEESEPEQEETEEKSTESIEETAPEPDTEETTEAANEPEEDTVLYEKGSSGDEIKEVQEKLIELGYLDGSADGAFGDMTEEAVRKYQEENGLEISGVITTNTVNSLNLQADSENNGTFNMAFINPGKVDSTYYMFDTVSKKVVYFDINDGSVMESGYTGEFSEGVDIDWSAYNDGEEWNEKFIYKDGDSSATLEYDGFEVGYQTCDVESALEVLNTKPGYEPAGSTETEPATEKETSATEKKTSTDSNEDEYSGGRYEGMALTSLKNMANAVYPYGVKFHSFASESTIRYEGNGVWYVKQKVDITNEYGAKRSTCLECDVDFIENKVKNFKETN